MSGSSPMCPSCRLRYSRNKPDPRRLPRVGAPPKPTFQLRNCRGSPELIDEPRPGSYSLGPTRWKADSEAGLFLRSASMPLPRSFSRRFTSPQTISSILTLTTHMVMRLNQMSATAMTTIPSRTIILPRPRSRIRRNLPAPLFLHPFTWIQPRPNSPTCRRTGFHP